jgi:hypothetical protein
MKSKLLVFSLIVGGLSACASQPSKPPVVWSKEAATSEEIVDAKETVVGQLKDPESARFGEIWAMSGTNGKRTICGYVNAKNSFGGYTGKQMFTLTDSGVIFQGSGHLGGLLPSLCTPRTVK